MNETDTTEPVSGHIKDYVKPGMRVWFRTQHVNEKGKLVETLYGLAGDLTYQGYTTIANATFLVFERAIGSGRKSHSESFAVNQQHCPHIGPFRGQ